ncbi:MAG TPA: peptide-methionine (S)-S-oxide reductase MsrA, partial [Fimbriimonadaceae bacterium]|nr:peptide-methionine (S)-S-oxide reductase MsrA [Fimbriimonadaceae bacterium]
LVVTALTAILGFRLQEDHAKRSPTSPTPKGANVMVVGGGCFWCLDSMYRQLKGVLSVECGYAGGSPAGVSYEQVCSGTTGHAEVVRITFDPKQVSEADLLRIFFTVHNPTTLDRQGPDEGTQYRSVIFYSSPEEKDLAEKIKVEIEKAKIWDAPIVTSIEPIKNYTRAEDYHQDYFDKYEKATPAQRMMMNGSYCQAIIAPKVLHFRELYASKLKKQ